MYGSGRMLGCHRDLYDTGLRDFLDETATPGRNDGHAPHTKQHGKRSTRGNLTSAKKKEAATE